jgi:hypothetical protein
MEAIGLPIDAAPKIAERTATIKASRAYAQSPSTLFHVGGVG